MAKAATKYNTSMFLKSRKWSRAVFSIVYIDDDDAVGWLVQRKEEETKKPTCLNGTRQHDQAPALLTQSIFELLSIIV